MTVIAEQNNATAVQPDNGNARLSSSYPNTTPIDTKLTVLLIAILALTIVLAQFVFRSLDNNRLVSWQWVMNQETVLNILIALVLILAAVYKSCFTDIRATPEILALVAVSFVLSAATWALPEFMVDTGRYFTHAKLIASHGLGYFITEWGYKIDAWTDMPIASILFGITFNIFGESRHAIQFVNTLFLSGTVLITYLTGKELWNEKSGISAAWLMLAIPFLHVQASQMLVDIPAMFFTMLAVLLAIVAVRKPGYSWILLASVAIVTALLTKYSVIVALLPIAVLPIALNKTSYGTLKRMLTLVFTTLALMALTFYAYHPIIIKQLTLLSEYQIPALHRWQESYISTFFYQVHPFVTMAGAVSVYFAVKKKEVPYILPACAIAAVLAFGVCRARYLIIVFPFFALAASYGIQQLSNPVVRRFITRSAAAVSIVITTAGNTNFLSSTSAINIKNAGEYINSLDHASMDPITMGPITTLVLPQPQTSVNPAIVLPVLDYYTNKPLAQIGFPTLSTTPNERPMTTWVTISPLRFTWEVDSYFYPIGGSRPADESNLLVLISGSKYPVLPSSVEKLLNSYEKEKAFAVTDRVFRFQSIITIYRRKAHNQI